jgi:peptidoglycan/xylan/chitin deacetylase (PgdA/CDA1 family)
MDQEALPAERSGRAMTWAGPSPLRRLRFRFPGGRAKALTLSYDDGSEHDRRLVSLLNHYGLRATFHLNSGVLDQPHHITGQEVAALYAGHEVACHSVTHRDLTTLAERDIQQELAGDRDNLGRLLGYPIRGLAYPYGRYDPRVAQVVRSLDLVYARTAQTSGDFAIPADCFALSATCHHNDAAEYGQRLLERDEPTPAWMLVWGHSFELDGFLSADCSKDWHYIEAFCGQISRRDDIFYATTIEVVSYLQCVAQLQLSASLSTVENTLTRPVWLQRPDAEVIELAPGQRVDWS